MLYDYVNWQFTGNKSIPGFGGASFWNLQYIMLLDEFFLNIKRVFKVKKPYGRDKRIKKSQSKKTRVPRVLYLLHTDHMSSLVPCHLHTVPQSSTVTHRIGSNAALWLQKIYF